MNFTNRQKEKLKQSAQRTCFAASLLFSGQAMANTCTVAFEQQQFNLDAQTVVEVSTDCDYRSVAPPPQNPPPPPPPSSGNYSTWFDGSTPSGSMVDRVQVRVNDAGDPANVGSGDFTVAAWLKPTSVNDNSQSPSYGYEDDFYYGNIWFDRTTHGGPGFGSSLDQGRVVFNVRSDQGKWQMRGETDLRDGQWHHVALVREGTALYIFVDGIVEAYSDWPAVGDFSTPEESTPWPNSDPYMVIGEEKHGYDTPPYDGGVFDLCIASSALYTADFTPPTAAQTGCDALQWMLDDQNGATDLSGNGNDGMTTQSPEGYPQVNYDAPF